MLKAILSRFKDSGIIKLFVYSGISGDSTMKHTLKSGEVKFGIHLHQLIFKAIIRTKIIFPEKSGLFSTNEMHFRTLSTFRNAFQKKNFKMFMNHYRLYQS